METDEQSSIWDHVGELRKTFIAAITVIVVGFSIAFYFSNLIISFFSWPLNQSGPHRNEIKIEKISNLSSSDQVYSLASNEKVASISGAKEISPNTYLLSPQSSLSVEKTINHEHLVILGPLEGMMISFKVSFWVGIVLTSPIWIYFILNFIAPGLRKKERKLVLPFLLLSICFLSAGFALAYFLTIPLANQYLLSFNNAIGTNLWSLSNYLDYTLILILANGLAFELALILLLLVHFEFISAQTMADKRRHMIVIAFIVGAILTPPDVLTQFLLAIPLILLYELTILYAKLKPRKPY